MQIPDELFERLMAEIGRRLIAKKPETKMRHVVIEALDEKLPAVDGKKARRS